MSIPPHVYRLLIELGLGLVDRMLRTSSPEDTETLIAKKNILAEELENIILGSASPQQPADAGPPDPDTGAASTADPESRPDPGVPASGQ